MNDRFTRRTPCADNPTMFDQDHEGETPQESNARMEWAASLCKSACPEYQKCLALYPPSERKAGTHSGVVAGRFRPRRGTRKSTAVYGRYSEGDPCAGCGSPMVVDVDAELDEIPEGYVQRFRAARCKSCYGESHKAWKRRKKAAASA